jgi:hypothetical protein
VRQSARGRSLWTGASAAWKAWRMVDKGWASGDSWVLTAVAISGRGVDLSRLIASGDACNHAILERSEIERGLGRLVASGLVHVDRISA